MMNKIVDLSFPICNGMWAYRSSWKNDVETICSTVNGDGSTAYRFNLCSHTGTYIETSQHKLPTDVLLEHFRLESFVRTCTVVCLPTKPPYAEITKDEFAAALGDFRVMEGDALLVGTGWGSQVAASNYIEASPYFDKELTEYLASLRLGLIGVDVPVIDCQYKPYNAVALLFRCSPQMLFLAPLVIDPALVGTGLYTLSALPISIKGVCASHCRPVLLPLQ